MWKMDRGTKMLESGEDDRNWTEYRATFWGAQRPGESRKRSSGRLPEYSLLMLGRLAGQELLTGRPCWGIPWFPYMSMRLA